MKSSFWKAGHPATLFAAFLCFDLSFMVWAIPAGIGLRIVRPEQREGRP